jgi:hypothetical protein
MRHFFYTIRCSGCGVIRSYPIADDTQLSGASVIAQATHGDDCPIVDEQDKTVEIDASNPGNVIYAIS